MYVLPKASRAAQLKRKVQIKTRIHALLGPSSAALQPLLHLVTPLNLEPRVTLSSHFLTPLSLARGRSVSTWVKENIYLDLKCLKLVLHSLTLVVEGEVCDSCPFGMLVLLFSMGISCQERALFADAGHQDKCPVSELLYRGSSLRVHALGMSQGFLLEISFLQD